MSLDQKIRLAAFKWLSEQVSIHGDVLPRKLLEKGFVFDDNRISLISPQGIFKPKIIEYPLTITTAPEGPYNDFVDNDKFLSYRYRGTDPNHRDNIGLRGKERGQISTLDNNAGFFFNCAWPGPYESSTRTLITMSPAAVMPARISFPRMPTAQPFSTA
jgi:hypothetical protein